MIKNITYFFEGMALHLVFFIFRMLPLDTASNFGGWLGKTIGPKMGVTRHALKNLTIAMPDLNQDERLNITRDMWENLGRIIAEYPHLENIGKNRTEIHGKNVMDNLEKASGPAMFFSGHLSNWEICGPTTLTQLDKYIDTTYRAPNNPWADTLLGKARTLNHKLNAYPKSKNGGRQIMTALKQNRYVGILIDQKYNEGISIPFFGQPAMTNPVFVKLCQKFKCPLIPVQGQRLNGANFSLTFHEPIELFTKDGSPIPVEEVMINANHILEGWIKDNPSQWLWLHKRWDYQSIKDT